MNKEKRYEAYMEMTKRELALRLMGLMDVIEFLSKEVHIEQVQPKVSMEDFKKRESKCEYCLHRTIKGEK